MLKADHQRIRDLVAHDEATTNPETQWTIAEDVLGELKVHAQLEEQIFYPAGSYLTVPQIKIATKSFCLVDSGASDIILNAQFAALLGIDLTAAASQEYQGIGDAPFTAYKHPVTIRVQSASAAFSVPCASMPDLRIDAILGQNGFFDTHKIVFEKYRKRFNITLVVRKKK